MFNHRTVITGLSAAVIAVSGIGVAGSQAASSLGPDTSCTSTSACTSTTNDGSGPATAATSLGGNGSTSTTKFASTSGTNFRAGILGTDTSAKGFYDVGVEGKSTRGMAMLGISSTSVGIEGMTNSTSIGQEGVLGLATAGGIGVEGKSGTGSYSIGVLGQGAAVGVEGYGLTSGSTAVEADGTGGNLFVGLKSGAQVFAVDSSGNVNANTLSAPTAYITNLSGGAISLESQGPDATGIMEVLDYSGGASLYSGYNATNYQVFNVDNNGNVTINGLLYTSGFCNSGCINSGPSQKRVVTYAPRESQPTMEDTGEGQLVNGVANVALDPAFANVMDQRANYLVFVTPEGDCNGLYIAGKSSARFTVRELRSGHSSLAFEYRIVAKPYGDHAARLPMIVLPHAPTRPHHALGALGAHAGR